ncbi:grc3 [Histoplasma capsulatum H143]|uniref:Polynucleotide 5'-hydroxyl-kinase GRC3 n=1 Tax=Ajellomyces capsulatus (strain H143) TaxID=544712 RepID=C6H757_AJECH|nr:grc3 [Histoplasma capsulatum H143]
MKRKGGMQSQSAPVSAIAARRSRQKLVAASQTSTTDVESFVNEEPPLKKTKTSASERSSSGNSKNRQSLHGGESAEAPASTKVTSKAKRSDEPHAGGTSNEYQSDISDEYDGVETEGTNGEIELQWSTFRQWSSRLPEFPVVEKPHRQERCSLPYGQRDLHSVEVKNGTPPCLCLMAFANERKNVGLIGQYDLWVKRGVVSMGQNCLRALISIESMRRRRIHSLRLRNLSNLYHRIWNTNEPAPGSILQPGRCLSFSILHSSSDDPLKRHLRPLHLDKKWSASIHSLSQRGGFLRVLTCGPKGSGKSTFNKYLLNHLLSPPPSEDNLQHNQHGVAFLDLDPGQPELSPMGQIYLAHLRTPLLGPPFSHPTLNSQSDGHIVRSHYIGASSPKDDPDHYIATAMDLMNRYQELLQSYPQCPLIINYPGPAEVVEPLIAAASEAGIPVAILPSQPTDFVSRSSAQLRSMQMLSYFHFTQHQGKNGVWSDIPLCQTRPVTVKYSGASRGIFGIMVTGIDGRNDKTIGVPHFDSDGDLQMEPGVTLNENQSPSLPSSPSHPSPDDDKHPNITHTPRENLPYLFAGNGACYPLDPNLSHCLGQAIIRSINAETQTLDIYTPIPHYSIREALEQGNRLVLVRGQVDNPNWAISEEYFSARAAERRHRRLIAQAKASGVTSDAAARREQTMVSERLRERVRRAGNVPWMRLDEGSGDAKEHSIRQLWRLRKKAYPADSGSGSDRDW